MEAGRPNKMPYPWNHLAYYMRGSTNLANALDISIATLHKYAHNKIEMRPHTKARFNNLVKEMEEKYAK